MTSAGQEGKLAKISIDGQVVELNKNENGHYRGLHIVVINPSSGKAEFAQVFDTFETSEKLNKFILEDVEERSIIAVACNDDCVKELSFEAI